MAKYRSDPRAADDAGFESGSLARLVEGNTARLLDPRRTPVRVVGIDVESGLMRLRVEAFEDEGALWALPFERVDRLQFPAGSQRLSDAAVAPLAAAVARLDREESRPADAVRRAATTDRISRLVPHAQALFAGVSPPLPLREERTDAIIAELATRWWREQDVADLEVHFARAWASNPASDETVKAHLLVLADLGLAPYRGPVLRDPARLTGAESVERRTRHVLARLAFVRAMFQSGGLDSLQLFRGYALSGPWRTDPHTSLVATTANRAVAEQHFDADTPSGVLQRSAVDIDRVFMTWLETPQLSHPYRESEVVVLARHDDCALF